MLQLARDPHRLGARIGFTAVLHTWTRDLRYHVHLHCIVTAGGLSTDASRWVHTRPGFLFPFPVLSQLFRGKFLHAFCKLQREGTLHPPTRQPPQAFDQLRATLYAKNWRVYAKVPFTGPKHVFRYLARYTHRVAISNHRILEVTPESVTIATGNEQTVTMTPSVFIDRFLHHVLPNGFVKIRHYGLAASTHVHTLLPIARALLGVPLPEASSQPPDANTWQELLHALTGQVPCHCPGCGSNRILSIVLPGRLPRAPPGDVS